MNMTRYTVFIYLTAILTVTIFAFGAACAQTSGNAAGGPSDRPYVYPGDYDTAELISSRDAESLKLKQGLNSSISFLHGELGFLLTVDELKEMGRRDAQLACADRIRVLYLRLIELLDGADSETISSTMIPTQISDFINDLILISNYVKNANVYAPLVKCTLRRAEALNAFKPKSYVSSVNDMLELEYPSFYGTANLVTAVWLDDRIRELGGDSPKADSLRQLCADHARIAVDSLRSNYGKSIACYMLAKRLSSSSKGEAWEYMRRAIDLSLASDFPETAFYSDVYTREVYLNEAVSFIPSYCEYLFGENESMRVLQAGEYLLDLGLVNEAQEDRIARAVIYWTERAIRENADPGAAALFRPLQRFYELDDPETEF